MAFATSWRTRSTIPSSPVSAFIRDSPDVLWRSASAAWIFGGIDATCSRLSPRRFRYTSQEYCWPAVMLSDPATASNPSGVTSTGFVVGANGFPLWGKIVRRPKKNGSLPPGCL